MRFNSKALEAKIRYLDKIKKHPEIVKRVLERNVEGNYELFEKERAWVGGGATTYVVKTEEKEFFLKIKHRAVTVESSLEEERTFIEESCISHEKYMLEKAKEAGARVPEIIFFDEESDFQFLATEYIPMSFEDAFTNCSLEIALRLWKDLVYNVRLLFKSGLVHCDVHEMNIRVKNNRVVLIDLEEARELKQDCSFVNSLDYKGRNLFSTLGEFPLANSQKYTIKNNSLLRMRQVVKDYLLPKIKEFISECNYDSNNGICTALDHGESELIYQSIHNNWLDIKGQREQKDNRPKLIWSLMQTLFADFNICFIDIGSNNGLFGREISKFARGRIRCIGLEGFHKYNILADALAFMDDCRNVEYRDFLCGKDNLEVLMIEKPCFITICSVWHHIQKKDVFLKQLKQLNVKYILFEMPIQKECYEGNTWEEEIEYVKHELGFKDKVLLGESHDYLRPLVLISKESIKSEKRQKIKSLSKKILKPSILIRMLAKIR